MIPTIIFFLIAFYWLLRETDYLRISLATGIIPEPIEMERISWEVCCLRNSGQLHLSPGVNSPLCGWAWLKSNTHPIPRVIVDFNSGGVRYHWDVKDCAILKDAITATHAKQSNGNGHYKPRKNKAGGYQVYPLPPKSK